MCKLQDVLRCIWEIEDCRQWGKRDTSYWPIQTEMDWALELRELLEDITNGQRMLLVHSEQQRPSYK